jgi:outer membrane receptor protein involved in Fe transport
MRGKLTLLAGVCAGAIAFPAFAQDAVEEDTGDAEIIVTATLRSENLQDVPLAVTAFSAESLQKAGVASIKNFEQVSASFNINSTQTESGGTTLRVRGVGTTGNNSGLESAVGIFLDGVYLSRPGVALGDLLDVQQIELLRGPQGTLFGRNTSAGAISIKTAKPNLNKIEGFANASYGNYDLMNVQAGVSVPISEGTAAIRLSGAWRDRDGFVRNAVGGESNDKNRYIVRGQLYAEPSPELSVRIIADYSKSDEKCCDAIIERESSWATVPTAPGGPTIYGLAGLGNNGGVSNSGPTAFQNFVTANNNEFNDKIEQWGVSGEINYDLGGAQLTSITAYRHSKAASQQESDFISANVFSTSINGSTSDANSVYNNGSIKTFTQELRIAGAAFEDKLDFLIGAYYSNEKIDEHGTLTMGADHIKYVNAALFSLGFTGAPVYPGNPLNNFTGGLTTSGPINPVGSYADNRFTQTARNWSIFTNETFHLSDTFKINVGLRYSDDKKDGAFDQLSASSAACNAARVSAATFGLPTSGALQNALAPLAPLAMALTCFPFAAQVLPNSLGLATGAPQEFDKVFKDNELIYTGKLLWQPSDAINTYVSYSHGYKSGGFNLDPTAAAGGADPRFRSETVNAWELGIKAKVLDNKLTANFALFQQDMADFQVLEFTGVQFQTFNVGGVRAKGFELETTFRPDRNLSLNAAVTYSDANYKKDCDRGVFSGTVSPLCGQSLSNAPDWTVVAGFDWSHPVGESLEFGLNGNIRMESDRRVSTQALMAVAAGSGNISLANFPGGVQNNYIKIPFGIQDANAKVNLRASIGSQDGTWGLEFWGNNIFDVRTKNVTFSVPLRGVGSLPGPFNVGGISVARGSFVQEPRTYGVTLRGKF